MIQKILLLKIFRTNLKGVRNTINLSQNQIFYVLGKII